jgi:hypothetical protein
MVANTQLILQHVVVYVDREQLNDREVTRRSMACNGAAQLQTNVLGQKHQVPGFPLLLSPCPGLRRLICITFAVLGLAVR